MISFRFSRFLLATLAVLIMAASASATDRHVGYYYPEPAQIETYNARSQVFPETNRSERIGFVTGIVQSLQAKPHVPIYSVFVKGDYAQKLIIASNVAGRLDTVYRVRALLAQMTSVTRTLPILQHMGVDDIFTFLDFLKMLGFEQITITDGDIFAHQILIK